MAHTYVTARALPAARFESFSYSHDEKLKRALDMIVSGVALILLLPLLCLIAIGILCTSRGPIFFRQSRKGLNGVPFRIYKFRTMTVCEDGENVRQATERDARVTALGRLLRKSSFDELPQLLNVLEGSMSLVGPRPHAMSHDNYYERKIDGYRMRQLTRPGVTGWAQINGLRGETRDIAQMEERIRMDLWYVENWSFLLDVEILWRTLKGGFISRAAY